MIKDGSKVSMHYKLEVDGQVVDSSEGGDPLSYVHGEGEIIPGLEKELEGLGDGEKKAVVVSPESGYGTRDESLVRKVPRDAFDAEAEIEVGDMVQGESGGETIQASITELGAEHVTLDMNHPLAGKELHFQIEIVSVS